MYCMNCGTENQDGVKFCAGCGAQMVEEPQEEMPARAPRASRPAKKKFTFGMVQMLVALFAVLALIFGFVHLFVDYVVEYQAVTKSSSEEGKTYEKEEGYVYKSMIYQTIADDVLGQKKDEIKAAEEGMEMLEDFVEEDLEVKQKLTGSLGWVRLANILGGILCIAVSAVGILYVLKDMVPVYDMAFGKFFKGRTALFVMGLCSAVTFLLHWLLNALTRIRYVVRMEEATTKTVATVSVHWTVWAFLIIGVLAMVYEMTALSRKKK